MQKIARFAAVAALLLGSIGTARSQNPEITSWILNLTGQTGYNNILSNVQRVRYSNDNVYVSCSCIPGFDIGPWAGNPNTPINQNFTFRITRHPQANTGMATATPNGHIGVFLNGVSIFNTSDARSYNNQNIWHQDALLNEGSSFDDCLGHPAPNGEYHHHVTPNCMYDELDSLHHSPLLGYAFDGYPVYGGYGFSDPNNAASTIKRMVPGYRQRSITQRRTKPDGTTLQPNQYGPDVSAQYPLGKYVEDYEFVSGLGDLDVHNGRFCKTPEYPNGTYAYFITINRLGQPVYPYTLGSTYYGVVITDNVGPQSGHVTPSEPVTEYIPAMAITQQENIECRVGPNPFSGKTTVRLYNYSGAIRTSILDMQGRTLLNFYQYGDECMLDLSSLPAGTYQVHVRLEDGAQFRSTVVRQ